jgi:hypothetical protein
MIERRSIELLPKDDENAQVLGKVVAALRNAGLCGQAEF